MSKVLITDKLSYRFIDKLKALPFVEAIYLFGSRARGDNQERSDIDIAVKIRENTHEKWREVMEVIEEADTLLEIDCVNIDEIDGAFRDRVLSEGKRI